jgi:hypothetical protein
MSSDLASVRCAARELREALHDTILSEDTIVSPTDGRSPRPRLYYAWENVRMLLRPDSPHDSYPLPPEQLKGLGCDPATAGTLQQIWSLTHDVIGLRHVSTRRTIMQLLDELDAGGKPRKPATRGATVNQRMLAQLRGEPQSTHWTQRTWAEFLGCSPSAVAQAPAWKTVKTARALEAAGRLDRRRGRKN